MTHAEFGVIHQLVGAGSNDGRIVKAGPRQVLDQDAMHGIERHLPAFRVECGRGLTQQSGELI